MNLSGAIAEAKRRAYSSNSVFMVLAHRNHQLSWTVYYVYEYDGRDSYIALVYPDGFILYE